MPLYHFKPKPEGFDHPDWKSSIFKTECYVNAANYEKAVQAVVRETNIAIEKSTPGQNLGSKPWRNPDLVDVIEVTHIAGDLPPEGVVMFETLKAA